MRVHSAVLYSPTASKIVLAAKENGLKGADDLIVDAIVHVLLQARFDTLNIHLVPIPSSASTRRYRGRSFMVDITQKVAELTSFPISDCLQLVRKVRDQSTLPARSRLINMEGAIGIKAGAHPRGDLILIDDVMTTGATLGEAARALRAHGSGPIASVTACVSQPLR